MGEIEQEHSEGQKVNRNLILLLPVMHHSVFAG